MYEPIQEFTYASRAVDYNNQVYVIPKACEWVFFFIQVNEGPDFF